MKHFALTILVPLLWLSATVADKAETQKKSGSTTPAAPQKESAMFVDDLTTADSTIPPIDRAAPDNFETAAFGLG